MDLTVGISPCPNDVWIFAGLILGFVGVEGAKLQFRYEDVQSLNVLAAHQALDVLKISYASLFRFETAYELLSSGGALGRGVGPLLLTNGARFDPERVILSPGEGTTANLLLTYYLGRAGQFEYVEFDELYRRLISEPGAQGVVIHEKRFTYAADGLTLIQDLGAFWEERTKSPIPLGCIVARKSLSMAAELDSAIRNSLAWSESHPEEALELCRQHASDMTTEVMKAHIALYVNEYSTDLGPEGRRAVHTLRQTAALMTALQSQSFEQ